MIERRLSTQKSSVSNAFASVFICLFMLPFLGFGVFAISKGIQNILHGEIYRNGIFLCLFGLVFCAMGLGIICAVIFASRFKKKTDTLAAAHPDEPWLWRADWAQGRVISSAKGAQIGAWIIAIFWNFISVSILCSFWRKGLLQGGALVIMLLLTVVGMALLVWAVRATIRWRKFGESVFKMLSIPGVVGGQLGGAIETSGKVRPTNGFLLRLICVERIQTGSGDSSSTTETILWEEKKTETKDVLADDPRRSGIPVLFHIPSDARESDSTNSNDKIIWRLEVKASVPGVNYSAKFEVPVFRTAASVTDLPNAQGTAETFQLPPHSRITVRTLPDGATEFYFPAARNPGAIGSLTLFTAIWSGVFWFMLYHSAPLLFAIIFGVIDFFLIVALLNLLTKSSRVIVDALGMTVHKWWVIFRTQRRIAADDVATVMAEIGMTSNQTAYYNVKVKAQSYPNAVAVATGIRDKREAEWLASEMRRYLKLDKAGAAPSISR